MVNPFTARQVDISGGFLVTDTCGDSVSVSRYLKYFCLCITGGTDCLTTAILDNEVSFYWASGCFI